MSSCINIKLEQYHSDVFINYKIKSYDNVEWIVEISNNTQQKDLFTINGLDNLMDLIMLSKDTLSTITLSIILDTKITLFTERYIVVRELYLKQVFEIYMAMDINKKKRELQVLKLNMTSHKPSNVTNEIIKCLL
jgi:hypothetical protein